MRQHRARDDIFVAIFCIAVVWAVLALFNATTPLLLIGSAVFIIATAYLAPRWRERP